MTYLLVGATLSLSAQEHQDSWVKRNANSLKQRLDSALFRKVDTNYIEVPQKAWRVILRPKISQQYTEMSSICDDELLARMETAWGVDLSGTDFSWNMRLNQPAQTAIGFWIGYRGLGIGYSQSLTKHTGRHFTLSSTGASYGVTLRWRRFSSDDLTVTLRADQQGETREADEAYRSYAPIWVTTLFLDGYYVFSGRRYSQAAAYNQSVIQRRSAGSFLLGLSWYQSSIDLSDKLNGELADAANGIGKMQVHQGSVGFGYGYNWVPARNWLVNVMVMPTVSFYNRVKVTKYASNYDFLTCSSNVEDYGAWDSEKKQWANGQKVKPLPINEEEDLSWQKDVENWETGTETKNTRWQVNINCRAGITYYGKSWFASVNGQLHRFSYHHNSTEVKLYDWYVQGSLGFRF